MRGIDVYNEQKSSVCDDTFIIKYRALVHKIAKHLKRRLPSMVEFEDLIQSGFIGLMEAKQNFKEDQGASFETFASIRVKGAMLDELRKNSWGTRQINKSTRDVAEAVNAIEQEYQRPATSTEIAEKLNISVDEYDKICQKINLANVMSIEGLDEFYSVEGDESNPETINGKNHVLSDLKETLANLKEREQILLSLYYVEELTFNEIADVLELTEARVCQLHAAILSKVKHKLQ